MPQTPSAGLSALALGLPDNHSWGPVQCSGAARPARFRCPQTPSAGMSALALGLPDNPGGPSTLLVNERLPAPGTYPAHVGGERIHVRFGDEVLVGRHLDRLAPEEAAADRVLGDARELALRDPGP